MKVTIQGVPGHFDTTHNYTTPEVAARLNMTDRWVLWAADRHRIQGRKRIGTAGKWNWWKVPEIRKLAAARKNTKKAKA